MGVSHVVVWIYALIIAVPLYYLLVSSLKENQQIFRAPFALPSSWSWHNFADAWTTASLGQALLNSVYITVGAELITLGLALPAAYALARSRGKIAGFMEKFYAAGFLIPGFAALVPTVLLAASLGLFRTRIFLILFLPATALPLSVILLTQYIRTIPLEVEEAAMVDGASRLKIFMNIVIPMSVPGITTVALLNFMSFWNEYIFSLALLGPNVKVRTLQVALPTLQTEQAPNYGLLMAGTVLTLIPVYILYAILQDKMEKALVEGSIKG